MRILSIGPILPRWSEIKSISQTLDFLRPNCQIHFTDPLKYLTKNISPDVFFTNWKLNIINVFDKYDAFFGFSFGGVILQNCFDIFENSNKKIVLFSTPTFADKVLTERLSEIIKLVNDNLIQSAIDNMNKYVLFPNKISALSHNLENIKMMSLRLSRGLGLVLQTDNREILKSTNVDYMNLIGEKSKLVSRHSVMGSHTERLALVPNAGMRVLQDNLPYCISVINQFLEGNK